MEPTRDERFNRYLEEFLVEHDEVLRRLARGPVPDIVLEGEAAERAAEILRRRGKAK